MILIRNTAAKLKNEQEKSLEILNPFHFYENFARLLPSKRLCNSLLKMTTPKRIYSSFRITKRTMIATKIANFNTRLKRSSDSPKKTLRIPFRRDL
jgi:hypothetical protein